MSAVRYASYLSVRILRDLLVLFACLQVGKWIAAVLPFRFPDSIIGLLFLFLLLNFQLVKLKWIERGAGLLLKHMALLFIPVAVGLLGYMDLFLSAIGTIVINILVGLFLILLVVGKLFQRMNQ